MNSMNKLIIKVTVITALIFQYSLNASDKLNETYVMGFGSCITEKREQPIWNAIEKWQTHYTTPLKSIVFGKAIILNLESFEIIICL